MENKTCCLCGAQYNGEGHNPDPLVGTGRCCTACNVTTVIPARISLYYLGQGGKPHS